MGASKQTKRTSCVAAEFVSPADIRRRHGVHRDIVGGGAFGWRPGQGTDDTDPPVVGLTTREALRRLRRDGDSATSGLTSEHSCGNGSLMRALPTALVRSDPARRRAESTRISAVAHAHPRCIDRCVAYNEIAAALLEGHSPVQAIDAARQLDLDPDTTCAIPSRRRGALEYADKMADAAAELARLRSAA